MSATGTIHQSHERPAGSCVKRGRGRHIEARWFMPSFCRGSSCFGSARGNLFPSFLSDCQRLGGDGSFPRDFSNWMTGFLENFCPSDFPSLNLTVWLVLVGFVPLPREARDPKKPHQNWLDERCNYSCITTTQTQPCIATFVPTKPSAHHVLTYLAQGTSALASPDGWPVDTTTTLRRAKWES